MNMLRQTMEQSQSLRQEQIMAPQQIQSLEILQATVQELEQKISEALVDNPTLELVDVGNEQLVGNPLDEGFRLGGDGDGAETGNDLDGSADAGAGNAVAGEPEAPPASAEAAEEAPPSAKDENEAWDEELSAGEIMQEFLEDYAPDYGTGQAQNTAEDDEKRQFRFDSLTASASLPDLLMEQLGQVEGLNDDDRRIGEEIIGSIDDTGYLRSHPADIAIACGAELDRVKRLVAVIQTFDPAGVGAQDLRECLLLQLERQGKKHSLAYQVVAKHLDDIGRNQIPHVAKALRVSPTTLYEVLGEIKKLVPHPGSLKGAADDTGIMFIVPEVTVTKDEHGEWRIETNREYRPRLRISQHYIDLITDPDTPAEAKAYIRQKIQDSKLLLRALSSRDSTIERITRSLLKFQRDFFESGIGSLHPLTLQEVGRDIGLHETTVGRATANKYLRTPHGLLPFKQFFSSGMATHGGAKVSNVSIKQKLLEVIRSESSGAPLADQDIVKLLAEQGFPLARRTVAKYREELGILPSHMRKNFRMT